jgi:hypothetical protein
VSPIALNYLSDRALPGLVDTSVVKMGKPSRAD